MDGWIPSSPSGSKVHIVRGHVEIKSESSCGSQHLATTSRSPCQSLRKFTGIHVSDENQHSRRYEEHVSAHYKTKVNANVHCFVEQTTCTVDSQLYF